MITDYHGGTCVPNRRIRNFVFLVFSLTISNIMEWPSVCNPVKWEAGRCEAVPTGNRPTLDGTLYDSMLIPLEPGLGCLFGL
jgi:hypothetical protein